jgi:hypothetical protein
MVLVNEDALPKISDFAVWNDEGDFTEGILSGNKAVIFVTFMAKMNTDYLDEIDEMVKGLKGSSISPIIVAASSVEEIQELISSRNWGIEGYQGDATVIKTIMRSNPGVMLLKDGTVLKKYHYRNTPGPEEVKSLFAE